MALRADPRSGDYYENGSTMIYVLSASGKRAEVEDCVTLRRWITSTRELRGWRKVKEERDGN